MIKNVLLILNLVNYDSKFKTFNQNDYDNFEEKRENRIDNKTKNYKSPIISSIDKHDVLSGNFETNQLLKNNPKFGQYKLRGSEKNNESDYTDEVNDYIKYFRNLILETMK